MISRKWLQEPQISIISIFVSFTVLPIVSILLAPVFLIRYFVHLLSRVFKPEFREMLSGYSTLLAVHDVYTKPSCTGISVLLLDNELDMGEINRIGKQFFSNKKFEKAKQILVTWMGFFFWRDNPDFSLQDHLIAYKDPIKDNLELEQIKERLLKQPFSRTKPLWDLHMFPNYKIPSLTSEKTCTVVIYRVHHCILDWYSMLDVLNEINKCLTPTGQSLKLQSSTARSKQTFNKPSKLMLAYLLLKHIIFGPYDFTKALITSVSSTLGTFFPKEPQQEQLSFETTIPLDHVKYIAKINEVKTAAVTFAAMSGAMRQLMIDLKVQPLPEKVAVCIPVPLPGPRPFGLCNYFSSVPIYAPVGLHDPFERLKHIQEQFNDFQYSTIPYGFYFFFQFLGGLFHWMAKFIFQRPVKSAAATLAPGPSDFNSLLGVNLMTYGCAGAMPYGDVVIFGFYSFSFNGCMYLRVTGDKMLFPDVKASQRFIGLIHKEIEILHFDADNGNQNNN